MKKQIVIKIIGGAIIFTFAMFFLQAISPLKVDAASTSGLNWDNPNKSGGSAYKFKPLDAINSQLIMQVVGCTGAVDKVSAAITGLFQKKLKAKMDQLAQDAIVKACEASKSAAAFGASFIMNTQVTPAIINGIDCGKVQNTKSDPAQLQLLIDSAKTAEDARRTSECFNGIAMTLARNQLTAMTRYTVNWINTGFNGNPMYVQNATALTNSLEKGVLENGLIALTNPSKAFPYGADFSRSMILSYRAGTGLNSNAANFIDSLASDLGAFITEPTLYLPNSPLTALERAQRANNTFAGDFSSGGWNAWLALTQRDNNNPLGFAMQLSQYEADQQSAQVQGTQNELNQNGGFLSQKKCVAYAMSNTAGANQIDTRTENAQIAKLQNSVTSTAATRDSLCAVHSAMNSPAGLKCSQATQDANDAMTTYSAYLTSNPVVANNTDAAAKALTTAAASGQGDTACTKWEVVTPGSIIKDELSNFVNSPVRQLELAKTINDSLNSVFSALLSKLQDQGLSGISDNQNSYVSDNTNAGANVASTDLLGNRVSLSSGYTDGSFDLTRDLGNIFIHNYAEKSQGDWNADKNLPELNIGVAPLDDQGSPLLNVYYTVSVAGNTKLMNEGYNGWAKGDRAFWDGKQWQNWKKGTANPIANRGVIQLQKDYIVGAKELLANLPAIMPKIGELDYCIPGPNPNWQANSSNAYSAFSDYAYSLSSEYKAGSMLKRDSQTYQIAKPGQPQYDNYKNLFAGTNTFSGSMETSSAREVTPDSTKGSTLRTVAGVLVAGPVGGLAGSILGGDRNNRNNINLGTQSSPDQVITTQPWIDLYNLSTSGTYQNNTSVGKIGDYVSSLLQKIGNDLQSFNTEYAQIMESTFGATGLMQKQFIENEATTEMLPNSAWLPMASDGLNITKDIANYATDIDQMSADYKDSIVQANANISKLNTIKDQVSAIIVAAQKRRDDNLIKILNAEAARNGTPVLTAAQYKTKYAACLDEENIVFYEDTDIFKSVGSEAGRCTDGIDNDLNGLIDAKDPACQALNVANSGIVEPITPNLPDYKNPSTQQQINNLVN